MGKDGKDISGFIFIACMFIGAGVGMLFDQVAAGGAIGMGLGFLFAAFFRTREIEKKPLEFRLPKTLADYIIIVIGLIIISTGILILYNPDLIYPYLAGIAAILIGFIILLIGLSNIRSRGI